MASLCERDLPQGLVAAFALFETPLDDLQLVGTERSCGRSAARPGNLGTLIRTADAVGAAAVALIEPCVDPFDPKTVRGTWDRCSTCPRARPRCGRPVHYLRQRGLRAVGADAHLGVAWGQDYGAAACALVLGNEARGLSADVRAHIEHWAFLPMMGGAESLTCPSPAGC
jgi:TrmH family RNA methyltransferase